MRYWAIRLSWCALIVRKSTSNGLWNREFGFKLFCSSGCSQIRWGEVLFLIKERTVAVKSALDLTWMGFKRTDHPKMKPLSSFTRPNVFSKLVWLSLLWNTKLRWHRLLLMCVDTFILWQYIYYSKYGIALPYFSTFRSKKQTKKEAKQDGKVFYWNYTSPHL